MTASLDQAWERHIGALSTRAQVLDLTGWTEQELNQAAADHRVLRLESDGNHAYLLAGFDDESPARPLRGIKQALAPWAEADSRGWAAASWLMSPQPELGGRSPREALLAGTVDEVADLAARAAASGSRCREPCAPAPGSAASRRSAQPSAVSWALDGQRPDGLIVQTSPRPSRSCTVR